MWELVLTTKKYYYWKHKEGFYNCTKNSLPPSENAGGYYDINTLFWLKKDSENNKK